jgi:hypothetical protein
VAALATVSATFIRIRRATPEEAAAPAGPLAAPGGANAAGG